MFEKIKTIIHSKLYKKIRYQNKDVITKISYLAGFPFIKTEEYKNNSKIKKTHSFILLQYKYYFFDIDKSKPLFYLKVNRMEPYSLHCLQHWIDIIHKMNADFIIICDKPLLKEKILEKFSFYNENIKFIESYDKPLRNIVKNICRTDFWIKATHAHLSTFYHAQKNGIKNFWNIDADDTMIMLSSSKCAELLENAQRTAEEKKIDAFSFDMHESQNGGYNWTFGITYIRGEKNWIDIFKNNKDKNWQKPYLYCETAFNLDCFFKYLRDTDCANNKSFYSENLAFAHYGNLTNIKWFGYTLYIFKNNKIEFPIFNILNNHKMLCDIGSNIEKIKISIGEQESKNFVDNNFLFWNLIQKEKLKWK